MQHLVLIFALALFSGARTQLVDLPQNAGSSNTALDSSIPSTQTPPVTDVPVTDVPVTDVPVTDVPVTDVPPVIPPTDIPPQTNTVPPQNTNIPPTPRTSVGGYRTHPPRSAGYRAGPQGGALCNPVTGVRARSGSIYAATLSRMGVQSGNCGSQAASGQQGGTVNPITGVRARQGGIYERVLRGAGVGASGQQGGTVNPITGVRARQGGIYETVLRGAGVGQQGGTVNPITGVRARPGSAYEVLLNAAGVRGGQEGTGLFGNTALVQAVNARGGLLAVADAPNAFASTDSSQTTTIPGWAVAGIVLLSVIIVATISVMIQLVFVIRSS